VQEFFKQKARLAVNPEHAIVLGNAIYGHVVRQRSAVSRAAPPAADPSHDYERRGQ
jgi:molecular chaperone DnaK (HSP70)